jgi:predicted metal-dependent hydrolase
MSIIITYRRTSRLSMRIAKNGDVHVSAPIGLPKAEIERFIEDHREWIKEARQKTYEREKARYDFYHQLPLRTEAQIYDALQRAENLIRPMVEAHAQEMGISPTPLFYYKPNISRWGQCDVNDKSICFSIYLLLLPDWCVEHVVVHELCHLLEPSHNARFHALMDKYFPRWREARAETRRLSQMEPD